MGDDSTFAEIAELMSVGILAVIQSGFKDLGLLMTADQRPGFDQLSRVAAEFGFTAVRDDST